MVAGGASSAFAKDKHDDHGKYKQDKHKVYVQTKGNQTIELKISFEDVEKEAAWAWKYIAELAAQGVFNGYTDGTFRPNQHMTRIEAIKAAVSLMGLEDQAKSQAEMETDLNFKDAEQIPAWAVGYVAVAAENDLFTETETMVQPQKKADRLWATTLLIKALKLEDEAKKLINTKLEFKDAKAIPAGSVGYVALAVQKGLITGYNDNTFQPNKPVTRAELAALLKRTDDQMPQTPGQINLQLTGTVSGVNGSNVSIVKDGKTTAVNTATNVFVWRNGAKVDLTAIVPGDQVTIHTFQGLATFIDVTTPASDNNGAVYTATGKYQSHRLDANGNIDQITVLQEVYGQNPRSTIYAVDKNVQVAGGNAFSLKANETPVELLVVNQVVTVITIKDSK
jgi:hypothetical protein